MVDEGCIVWDGESHEANRKFESEEDQQATAPANGDRQQNNQRIEEIKLDLSCDRPKRRVDSVFGIEEKIVVGEEMADQTFSAACGGKGVVVPGPKEEENE
jgi:hypothetical protein